MAYIHTCCVREGVGAVVEDVGALWCCWLVGGAARLKFCSAGVMLISKVMRERGRGDAGKKERRQAAAVSLHARLCGTSRLHLLVYDLTVPFG